jgi:hypothetical protein
MAHPKTNVEFITQVMTFSQHGALMQAFVMEALRSYAETVVQNFPDAGTPVSVPVEDVQGNKVSLTMNMPAWKSCAQEYLTRAEAFRNAPMADNWS